MHTYLSNRLSFVQQDKEAPHSQLRGLPIRLDPTGNRGVFPLDENRRSSLDLAILERSG